MRHRLAEAEEAAEEDVEEVEAAVSLAVGDQEAAEAEDAAFPVAVVEGSPARGRPVEEVFPHRHAVEEHLAELAREALVDRLQVLLAPKPVVRVVVQEDHLSAELAQDSRVGQLQVLLGPMLVVRVVVQEVPLPAVVQVGAQCLPVAQVAPVAPVYLQGDLLGLTVRTGMIGDHGDTLQPGLRLRQGPMPLGP